VDDPIPRKGNRGTTSASTAPSRAASSTSPSGACGAGFPVSFRSSCEPPRIAGMLAPTL
jgi:hypothetical protein